MSSSATSQDQLITVKEGSPFSVLYVFHDKMAMTPECIGVSIYGVSEDGEMSLVKSNG